MILPEPKFKIERDENHIYTVDGRRMPGVTSICRVLDDPPFQGNAFERGRDIHSICDDYDMDTMDYEIIPEYRGYLDAWVNFVAHNKFGLDFNEMAIEVMVASKYGFAGQIDRVFAEWLLDLKTGVPTRTHPHQLFAYRQGFHETFGGKKKNALDLYLQPNGKYVPKVRKFETVPWNEFLAARTVWNFKHGGKVS